LASFWREYLVFPASYSCTDLLWRTQYFFGGEGGSTNSV
jgi:hypothetical protein